MPTFGFTGTRAGMSPLQRDTVSGWLKYAATMAPPGDDLEFHHGDCVGADAEAAAMAILLNYRLVCHPPVNPKHRAWVPSDVVHRERHYLERNREIVLAAPTLIAAPPYMTAAPFQKTLRGGTFYTMRQARSHERTIWIAWPNGSLSVVRPDDPDLPHGRP